MIKKTKIAFLTLGIGIGIIISSTLHSLYPKIKLIELEDEMIIERARELGMVNLKDSIKVDIPKETPKETLKDESLEQIENDVSLAVDDELEEIEEIEIVVESGSILTEVATNLYDTKLIEDKDDFISFVRNKKLDKKIITGIYRIKYNSSYEEIIQILTNIPKG